VEFKTSVNTVSNVVDLYDHSKHFRFSQILVLYCIVLYCIVLRLFLYFQCHILLVTYSRYLKEVVRANLQYIRMRSEHPSEASLYKYVD
jgi:hypothetical protein